MHMLLDLFSEDIKKAYSNEPQYIRVLGANKKGLNILNKIKNVSQVKIITKFSNYKEHKINDIDIFLEFEKKSTDLFFLGLDLNTPLVDMDFYISPYIK